MFSVFGKSTVSEFLGDRIVYRNLVPADDSLPSLDDLRSGLGIPAGHTPRKSDPDYARVIVSLLRAARRQDSPTATIQRLAFVGDTRLLDGTAFANICAAGGWSGFAFIGSENEKPPSVDLIPSDGGTSLYLSNRWSALAEFDRHCTTQGLPVDENAAVVIDLDKTALGARGRNAQVIDAARVRAVQVTVAGILGESFHPAAFQVAYDRLNQPEFHAFTLDNQDYLAYICLILGSGLYGVDELVRRVSQGVLSSFRQFIDSVQMRLGDLPPALRAVHAEIYANVLAGDPTPFKPFRRSEYRETVARLGCFDDDSPVEQLLRDEIVITQEVRHMALAWRARGALLFGLSDKPDEASLPTPQLAAQGYRPIHRTETHSVGMNPA